MKQPQRSQKVKPVARMKIRRITDEAVFTITEVNSFRIVVDPGSKPITHRSFECDYEVVE